MTTQPSMPLVVQRIRERNRQALEAKAAAENEAEMQSTQITVAGLLALQELVEIAQGDTQQPQHCRRVLLAVYNSYAWPLNLTSLRVLDTDLRRAALAVIEWSAVSDRELHEYLPHGQELMQRFAAIEKQEEQ
ncbi:hypothetical protein NH398_05690 [Halomonas sp. CnH100-B]|uniref:DUF7673 family protein n=1 Tax=Halomonas sp. CnH100-B TaxID=2954490 RepID=UPI00209696CE|nr:hypothetical protein [Halomonas sp. CnH100-B]MCO7228723.1 hypothetical protein [Halomonas sp. CnH100-B]